MNCRIMQLVLAVFSQNISPMLSLGMPNSTTIQQGLKALPVAAALCKEVLRVVLQIGAVNAQLLSVPWLSVRAIDLRPCLPSIEQADFLQLQPAGAFDIVVCAMVLNCVPTAKDRGDMLLKARGHLQHGGHAFIVTPLRCLNDSPYMTAKYFEEALAAAGLQVMHWLCIQSCDDCVHWSRLHFWQPTVKCKVMVVVDLSTAVAGQAQQAFSKVGLLLPGSSRHLCSSSKHVRRP